MKSNYKPAFLYRKADFFSIIFYWRASFDQPFIRFRKTYSLNRIHDIKERIKAAKVMIFTINEALANGYNPITDTIPDGPLSQVKEYSIFEAATIAKNEKLLRIDKNKIRTREAYDYHYNHFIKFLEHRHIKDNPANSFTTRWAIEYQSYCLGIGLSPVTINTKTEYLSTIFKMAAQKEMIPGNPFANIDKLKEKESTLYRLYTDDEIKAIKKQLLKECPGMWQIFLFIFYAFMRPNSIVNLKISDIELDNDLIFVNGATHKNGKDSYKQLLTPHRKYLEQYVRSKPGNHYLFSDGFKPGPAPITRRKVSDKWKELIIDGLGIDIKLYSGKHTGASLFVNDSSTKENLKWLQMQMSHASLETTSIYTNKLKLVKLDESETKIREI